MSERILTQRELNRALLARQMLLERAPLPALDATARLVGLQAQAPNAPYIGLWTRLRDFRRDQLTDLLERRRVVRATMMRSTLHLVTAEDYLLLRPLLQPALTRALHAFFPRRKDLDVAAIAAAARVYAEQAPRTFPELRTLLLERFPGEDPAALAYAVRTHLPLVQMPPGGAWGFAGSPAHALAEAWLSRPLTASPDGPRELIFRYLAAFGPATVRDIQAWSGLTGLKSAVAALKPELRTFRDERGDELLDLLDAPLPSAGVPAPPRFLPEFDNLILSHADRTRVVTDEHRPAIFLSAGRVRATFLVDGFVAGTWKIERTPGREATATLMIEPFTPLSGDARAALAAEGERLLRFAADEAGSHVVRFTE